MNQRHLRAAVAGAFVLVLAAGATAGAQDTVATVQDAVAAVRTLYSAAAYEEALAAIDRLRADSQPAAAGENRNLDQYRAFCLLALGRDAEAGKALEAVVTNDPFFLPDEREVSPRVMTLVHEVRRRLLPGVIQQQYADAKAAYDRKDFAPAAEQFARLLELIDDPDVDGKASSLGDLRTLAGGFLDLAKAAVPKPAPAAAAASPAPPPAPVRPFFDASDTDVTPPVARRQDVPAWPSLLPRASARDGVLDLVIDESGRVEHATMRQSIDRVYDQMLLTAAVKWEYKPALRNGKPVKYRRLVQVKLSQEKQSPQ